MSTYEIWSSILRHSSIVSRVTILIAAVVFAAGFSNIAVAQTVEDSVSVYEFVDAYQQAIRTRDPVALAAFFTEDADLVMYNLPRVRGRQAIENWWRDFWRSRFNRQEPERKGTFNIHSARFLAADIAEVNVESTTGGRDSLGAELQTRKARGTWLLHRQNGNWLVSTMLGMPTEKDSIILGASIETAKSLRPDIHAFVDAYEDAFNQDPLAVIPFFRDDAGIIVRNSPLIQGKQAIEEWWRVYFSRPRPFRALYIIDDIRAINDDVVQVNFIITGLISGTENELQPTPQIRGTWILGRESGKWLIATLRVLPGEDDRVIRRDGN